MASQIVTFEDLARFHREVIVPDLERRLDEQLDRKLGEQFDRRLGEQFDRKLDEQLDRKLSEQFDRRLGEQFERKLDEQLDRKLSEQFDRRLTPLAAEIGSLRQEFGELRDDVRSEITGLRHDMLTHFDAVYTRLDSMAVEQTALKGGLRRVEDRVTRLERKIS